MTIDPTGGEDRGASLDQFLARLSARGRGRTLMRSFAPGLRSADPSEQGGDAFVAAFQPIENLRTGAVAGFEVLARLQRDGALLLPDDFVPGLTPAGRQHLFRAMLGQAVALFKAAGAAGYAVYVSVNVENSLVSADGFVDAIEPVLAGDPVFAHHLVLEILEGEPIANRARTARTFAALRQFGVHVAVDDVGSAYSSLLNLKTLPVDVIKLDHGFARDLEHNPDDLMFVVSLLSLARGLGKILVVEGAETPAILDALRVLGVGYAQGYAIARPMPGEAVIGWLKARAADPPPEGPQTLLGVYASQLNFVETCRVIGGQPMRVQWSDQARDPLRCPIGCHFNRHGLHGTPMGRAHARFHAVMTGFGGADHGAWDAADAAFRDRIKDALASQGPQSG